VGTLVRGPSTNTPEPEKASGTVATLPSGRDALLEAEREAKLKFSADQRGGMDQLNAQLSEGGKSAFRVIQASLRSTGTLPTPEQLKLGLANDAKALNLGPGASLNDKDIALLTQALDKSFILQKPESLRVVNNPDGTNRVVGTSLVSSEKLGQFLNGVKASLQIPPNEQNQQVIASAGAINRAVDEFRKLRNPADPQAPVVVSEATSEIFGTIKGQQAVGKYDGSALTASLGQIKGMQPIPAAERKILSDLVASLPYGAEVKPGFDARLTAVNKENEVNFRKGGAALLRPTAVELVVGSGTSVSGQFAHVISQNPQEAWSVIGRVNAGGDNQLDRFSGQVGIQYQRALDRNTEFAASLTASFDTHGAMTSTTTTTTTLADGIPISSNTKFETESHATAGLIATLGVQKTLIEDSGPFSLKTYGIVYAGVVTDGRGHVGTGFGAEAMVRGEMALDPDKNAKLFVDVGGKVDSDRPPEAVVKAGFRFNF
jgi:hypothetical protein